MTVWAPPGSTGDAEFASPYDVAFPAVASPTRGITGEGFMVSDALDPAPREGGEPIKGSGHDAGRWSGSRHWTASSADEAATLPLATASARASSASCKACLAVSLSLRGKDMSGLFRFQKKKMSRALQGLGREACELFKLRAVRSWTVVVER